MGEVWIFDKVKIDSNQSLKLSKSKKIKSSQTQIVFITAYGNFLSILYLVLDQNNSCEQKEIAQTYKHISRYEYFFIMFI